MRCRITTEGFGDMVFDLFLKSSHYGKKFRGYSQQWILQWPGLVQNCERLCDSGRFSGQRHHDGQRLAHKGKFEANGIHNSLKHIRGALSAGKTMPMIRQAPSFLWFIRMHTSWMENMRHLERWYLDLKCWTPLQR